MTDGAQLPSGTKIFIKPGLGNTEVYCSLSGITLNGDIVSDYDATEDAYFALMPARYSELEISYVKVDISLKGHDTIQCYLGDMLNASDYAVATQNGIGLKWTIVYGEDVVEKDDAHPMTPLTDETEFKPAA